jgi:hypothetical protein
MKHIIKKSRQKIPVVPPAAESPQNITPPRFLIPTRHKPSQVPGSKQASGKFAETRFVRASEKKSRKPHPSADTIQAGTGSKRARSESRAKLRGVIEWLITLVIGVIRHTSEIDSIFKH